MVNFLATKKELIPAKLMISLGGFFFLPTLLIVLLKVLNLGIFFYSLLGAFFLFSIIPLVFHTYLLPSKLFHGFYLFNSLMLLLVIPDEFIKSLVFILICYCVSLIIKYKTHYLLEFKNQKEVLEARNIKLSHQLTECNYQIWELTNTHQDLIQVNSSLRQLATNDELTHLLNKRSFNDSFLAELSRAARNGQTFTFVSLEINHFSIFNESNHREKGEEVIKNMANILRDTLRLTDVISRYEWDQFAIILTETDLNLANIIIQRIHKAVEKFPFDGREILPGKKVSFSIGVVNYPLDGFEMKDLIQKAEKAMKEARIRENFDTLKYFSIYNDLLMQRTDNYQEVANEVKALLTLIDKKDQYTYRHSEKVVKYSLALADRLKLGKFERNNLKLAAILHDVGKIEIDSEILNKSDPLTIEELHILRRHPVTGANLINSFQGLQDIVPSIRYHHENYDGTGYPTGLKGEEIPLPARILALADSFDAMLNKRPYRLNLSLTEALSEIAKSSGIKYDPRLVGFFLEIINQDIKNDNLI